MQAELIYNPYGGQVVVRHELEEVVAFLNRCGWAVVYRETHKPMEATEIARKAVQNGAQVVIAAGGDGTINEVVNGIMGTEAALGVLPLGTTNSWALQMGIPALNPIFPTKKLVQLVAELEERIAHPLPANYYRKMLLDAARVLVEGSTVAVDVGEVAGRYFLMWAGIGLDAAVVESISLKGKRVLGTWAYVFSAIEAAPRYSSTEMLLNLDGKVMKTSTPLVIISNIRIYGGVIPIGVKASVNDSKLDVCVFRGKGLFTWLGHVWKAILHKNLQDTKMDYYQSREITIESAHPLPIHVDGEAYTKTPVTIHTLPLALNVIVPKNAPADLFRQQATAVLRKREKP